MQTAQAAIPQHGTLYRKRRARRTTPHMRVPEPRKDRAFVAKVRPRDEVVFGIVGMMEVDVVAEEFAADGMMAELVMHQGLPKRHDQMRSDRSHEI